MHINEFQSVIFHCSEEIMISHHKVGRSGRKDNTELMEAKAKQIIRERVRVK